MTHPLVRMVGKLALLALPVACVLGALELRLRSVPSVYEAKKDGIERAAATAELVILGSSEPFAAVNPDELSMPAYNLADTSQSLYYDASVLEAYLPRMPRLRFVVVTVSPFTLLYDLADGPEDWRAFFYLTTYGIDADERGPISRVDLRRYSYLARSGGLEALKFLRHRPRTNISDKGWNDGGWEVGDLGASAGAQRAAYHTAISKLEHLDENVRRVRELFDVLRARNVEPILLTLPVCKTYAANLAPSMLDTMHSRIGELSKEYGVRYFDLMADPRFEDQDFSDVDHLNARGAHKLTTWLDGELARGRVP